MKKASSKLYLLDVNVLIGIAWPDHQFHFEATEFLENSEDRWATCALTQLAFVRLSSNKSVIPNAKAPGEAAALLEVLVGDPLHVYVEKLPAPAGDYYRGVLGYQQLTDAYLLALARTNNAIFLTFDIRLKALAGAKTKVHLLGV